MKRLTLHRLASALLCLMLALSLTACGGKKTPAAGNGGVKETISDSRTDQTGQADPVKPSEPEAEVDQELVEECLDKLGFDLEYGGYPGAAAYLGYREVDTVPCNFNGIDGVSLVCLEKWLGTQV